MGYGALHSRPVISLQPSTMAIRLIYSTVQASNDDRASFLAQFPGHERQHETMDRVDFIYDGVYIRRLHHQNFYHVDLIINTDIGREGVKGLLHADTQRIKSFWSGPKPIIEKIVSLFPPTDATRKLHCNIHLRAERYDPACDCTTLIPILFQGKRASEVYGSAVSERNAFVWMDLDRHYRVSSGDCSRVLVLDSRLSEEPLGRLIWRLLDIETYTIMALRDAAGCRGRLVKISEWHQGKEGLRVQMSTLNETMISEVSPQKALPANESALANLTKLANNVTSQIAETRYKFTSAIAYADEVMRRIDELREEKLAPWPRIGTKIRRDLLPHIRTCAAVIREQENVSKGIMEAATILGARIDNMRARISDEGLELDKKNQQKDADFRFVVSVAAYALCQVNLINESGGWQK